MGAGSDIGGRRVLIVEDEMMIAMFLEDLLTDLGFKPVGPAARLEQAVELATSAALEAAILDVNLNGKETYPVADALDLRGVPFVFATGYGAAVLPERYRHVPVLQKPYRRSDLSQVLAQVTASQQA